MIALTAPQKQFLRRCDDDDNCYAYGQQRRTAETLRAKGLIVHQQYGGWRLTGEGRGRLSNLKARDLIVVRGAHEPPDYHDVDALVEELRELIEAALDTRRRDTSGHVAHYDGMAYPRVGALIVYAETHEAMKAMLGCAQTSLDAAMLHSGTKIEGLAGKQPRLKVTFDG